MAGCASGTPVFLPPRPHPPSESPTTVPQGSKIDLAAATKKPGSAEDVALSARDVVVVPKSRIANADLWVKQHIRDILPVEPYISPAF